MNIDKPDISMDYLIKPLICNKINNNYGLEFENGKLI